MSRMKCVFFIGSLLSGFACTVIYVDRFRWLRYRMQSRGKSHDLELLSRIHFPQSQASRQGLAGDLSLVLSNSYICPFWEFQCDRTLLLQGIYWLKEMLKKIVQKRFFLVNEYYTPCDNWVLYLYNNNGR